MCIRDRDVAADAAGDAPAGWLAAGWLAAGWVTAGDGVAELLEHAEATKSTAVAVPRSRHAIPRVAATDRVIVPPPWTDGRWHGPGLSSPIRPTSLPLRRVSGARTGRPPRRLPDQTGRRGRRCEYPATADTDPRRAGARARRKRGPPP